MSDKVILKVDNKKRENLKNFVLDFSYKTKKTKDDRKNFLLPVDNKKKENIYKDIDNIVYDINK